MATIRKRNHNTYQFVVSLGVGSDGKNMRKYKTYKVTEEMTPKQLQRHLEYEAHKFEQKVLSNMYIAPTQLTLNEFFVEWKTKWLEKSVSESTIMLRIGSFKNHISPVIGHFPMHKITTLMLLDLMENLTRKDGQPGVLSASSKHEIHKVLVSIFQRALEWNIIKENPMTGVDAPKQKRKESNNINAFSIEEVERLISESQTELAHWRLFILLALSTGMRRGEIIALEWKHINLNEGILYVEQSLTRGREGVDLKAPKSNSHRVVSLPDSVIQELKSYKESWIKEVQLLSLFENEEDNKWIFFNSQTRNHFSPDSASTWWTRFLKRKNFRHIALHDLRHTSATLLIAQNVHAKIISERLGHKKISTTMDTYGHALPSVDKEASEKMNKILTNKNS